MCSSKISTSCSLLIQFKPTHTSIESERGRVTLLKLRGVKVSQTKKVGQVLVAEVLVWHHQGVL